MNTARLQSAIRTFLRRALWALPWAIKGTVVIVGAVIFSLLASTGLIWLGSNFGAWVPITVVVLFLFMCCFTISYVEAKKHGE